MQICYSTKEKGPCRAFFQNRYIATVAKSRLSATKCATYLVTKAGCSRVIAISIHSFFEKMLIEAFPVFKTILRKSDYILRL